MLVIRGTKKVLDRVGGVSATDADRSTTRLGDWYVNVLFWRPQVALFVSEATLLPVLVPFAPAATLLDRFPSALLAHLRAHEIGPSFAEPELAEMEPRRLAKTASRSVLGVMNEFKYIPDRYAKVDGESDLLAVSLRLAETPCGPLYQRHISPDRELAATWPRRSTRRGDERLTGWPPTRTSASSIATALTESSSLRSTPSTNRRRWSACGPWSRRSCPRSRSPTCPLEVHAWTGFLDEYTHISGAPSRAGGVAESVSTLLVADACNVGLTPVVDEDYPPLSQDRLNWTAQNYVRSATHAGASTRLFDYLARLALGRDAWGGGEMASADGMRFVIPVSTIRAGYNPRYFGRQRGSTLYTWMADTPASFHQTLIPGTQRDSLYALDGLIANETVVRPETVSTDTAGASEIVFALAWTLG